MKKLENSLLGVKKNICLKDYSTFKIGGVAKYFFEAKTKEEIIEAIKMAKSFHLPFFILGGGSNILFSDKKYNGLVIKISNKDSFLKKNTIIAGAGINLSSLVSESVKNDLKGLEWAIGIPGTLGGAVYGNAGAFSESISDSIKSVEVLNLSNFKIQELNNDQCKFQYKESIFKKKKNLIILSCELNFKKGNKEKMQGEMKAIISQRKNSQPLEYPSIGCIFKNYLGVIKDKKIIEKYSQLEIFNHKKIIPAGFLIENCGLKGKKINDAKISEKHANFIINTGEATARDVLSLIDIIEKEIKKQFKIKLEKEIHIFH